MGFGAQPQCGLSVVGVAASCSDCVRQPHTQPLPKGKGFGDRDNKFAVRFKHEL